MRSREEFGRPAPSSIIPTRKRRRRGRVWRWSLLWLSILSVLGVTVATGVLWLTQLPPPINCRNISPLAADGDRLYCAQRGAQSGKLDQLVAAMKLVQHWSPNHPLYSEGQRMMKDWSETTLKIAQQEIKRGDRAQAVKVASQIPISSPLYPEAQAAIATWQQEWKQGEETLNQFQNALRVQNWQQAFQLLEGASASDPGFWSLSRVNALTEQLATEKQAWQQLEEARKLAQTNRLAQLNQALALAAKINPKSYAKAKAQTELTQWSRTLVQMAAISFKRKDFAGAIGVLEGIPINTPLYRDAQDWIRLARASRIAKQGNPITLVDALSAVRQIEPSSPLYSLAATQAALWQSQLQDYARLQVALVVASFDQRTGLTYAINQATKVAPGQPQRILAQTLIAQWRKEIQQIEDRNHLNEAQQLAVRGTIAELKAAVEIASKIQLGQPLRLDAQNAIAKWSRQIQTFEDQPILDLADTLAQRQDLMAAISTAKQIRPGRALYPEAQRAIADWLSQVQIAQDRPILEAATALATQERFDAAIATASQISPQRSLYGQAQAAIARWTLQRAAINTQAQSATPQQNIRPD